MIEDWLRVMAFSIIAGVVVILFWSYSEKFKTKVR